MTFENINIHQATNEKLKILDEALTDFNLSVAKELPRAIIKRLDFIAEDIEGQLVGGIQAMMVNWGILQVDLLYVFEKYRKLGIGAHLLDYVEELAIKNGCYLAHLDTFDFQAKNFYLTQGYEIFGLLNNCPLGHERYYMRKNLKNFEDSKIRELTRVGVYGVVMKEGQMLLIRQKKGPYAGKLDFPGGGIEFGESPELTLRREFAEEVAMEFDSLQLIDNLTAKINISLTSFNESHEFFHIGMIYRVSGCRSIREQALQELQHIWIDPKTLSKDQCSSLLWKYKQIHIDG